MERNGVYRFFGGSPLGVLVRLAALSFVVGIVLSALGVSPYDIVNGLIDLVQRIYNLGFSSVEWIVRYFLLGAVIVFPLWLLSRLFKVGRNDRVATPPPRAAETIIPPRR